MNRFFNKSLLVVAGMSLVMSACTETAERVSRLDSLAIAVTPAENREYSFTDKKSGFW